MKVKVAEKVIVTAKKNKAKVTKKKVPRALAGLSSRLKGSAVTGKKRRQLTLFTGSIRQRLKHLF